MRLRTRRAHSRGAIPKMVLLIPISIIEFMNRKFKPQPTEIIRTISIRAVLNWKRACCVQAEALL